MRVSDGRACVLAVVARAIAACAGGSRELRAADPAQALEGASNEAQGEVEHVAVRVAVGGWRGQPRDLEQRLTPVDVTVSNGSGKEIRLGPEAFKLVKAGGTALRALDQNAVTRALDDLAGFGTRPAPRRGETFPGYDSPRPGTGTRPGAPVPPPGSWYFSQLPSGTLAPGRQTSMLLFFDVPARTLAAAAFEVQVVDAAGAPLGVVRIPFTRE